MGKWIKNKNSVFSPVVTTTYLGESNSNLTTIDYYRHIRNAVSHSKCVYKTENGRCYVTFIDKKPKQASQHCEIKMLTSDVGKMLGLLQKQIMTYLNAQWSKRSMEKVYKSRFVVIGDATHIDKTDQQAEICLLYISNKNVQKLHW